MSAAVAAGLAKDQRSARRNMEWIIENHAPELKARWLRERRGGIKGWFYFLRTYGFEERLEVRRMKDIRPQKPVNVRTEEPNSTFQRGNRHDRFEEKFDTGPEGHRSN
jgi:hypothetical protein